MSRRRFTGAHAPESADGEEHEDEDEVVVDLEAASTAIQSDFKLIGMNLHIKAGEFVVIVGGVGSGKTAILEAVLGELAPVSAGARASVDAGHPIAYAPQVPFVVSDTIRANISLGRGHHTMNEDYYRLVLRACALEADLNTLPEGDMCQIGERGVTLSGGQRARVSLARAVYGTDDIILCDDVLSALDARVGAKVFRECFATLLAGKTRVLVTHNTSLLVHDAVSRILVVDDGRIVEMGSFAELTSRPDSAFNRLRRAEDAAPHSDSSSRDGSDDASAAGGKGNHGEDGEGDEVEDNEKQAAEAAHIIDEERYNVGTVHSRSWIAYLRDGMGSGSYLGILVLAFLFIIQYALEMGLDVWIGFWAAGEFPLSTTEYLGIYGGLAAGAVLALVVRSLYLALLTIRASTFLFERALLRLMRAPMGWFNANPSGRILARLSRDVNECDINIPGSFEQYGALLVRIAGIVILAISVAPPSAIAIVPAAFLFYGVSRFIRPAARDSQRIIAVSSSPMFESFTQSLDGVSVIRGMRLKRIFFSLFLKRLCSNVAVWDVNIALNQWLEIRATLLRHRRCESLHVCAGHPAHERDAHAGRPPA